MEGLPVTAGFDTLALSRPMRLSVDAMTVGSAILALVLVVGLATASHYGMTVDEFNTDDYGPKALAWYTSGFTDRAHFETVEFSLWYYGPWLQILIAFIQSFGLADPLTVRHALTFLAGLTGLAALIPLARLTVGRLGGTGGARAVPHHRHALWQPVLHADRRSVSRRHVLGDTRDRRDGAPRGADLARDRLGRSCYRPRHCDAPRRHPQRTPTCRRHDARRD